MTIINLTTRLAFGLAATAALSLMASDAAFAQKAYSTGATDTEIKIGNIMPYSGPASAYSTIGKTFTAYFKMVNEQGGINGRKINFISYDDGYSPPKTVEQTRKLVENDEVLLLFGILGTPGNTAIHKYLNTKKIPHLFLATGASKWADPQNFPWTMSFIPNYQSEARIYAQYILKNHPNAKIGVLYQNDDFGKDYLIGLKDGLGTRASMIVSEAPFEVTAPTIDSQIVQLKSANADVLLTIATPKFAAQSIKKVAEIGWKPVHILTNVSTSVNGVIKPAGFENAQGVMSAVYLKDPNDSKWANDPGIKEWSDFMDKYFPEGDKGDNFTVYGYAVAKTMAEVLRKSGDNLTRENVLKQATNLDIELGQIIPGIRLKTSPTDYNLIEQLQMQQFKGNSWHLFGPLLSSERS
jgi:ABC-type branched-subunit amino acid transport system substrate-binding protein